MDTSEWYDSLAKPSWTPSPEFIGLVWTVLYPIIIVSFGYMTLRVLRSEAPPRVLVPVLVNVVANLAFTPIQFGLRDLALASVDIVVVLISCAWCIAAFWPYSRAAALALTPYLVWVLVATVLQLSIAWMNR